ncbi:YCII-related domain protein [Lacunisphaera limnophila]|uniref:YCII-related domain protein n=1 Tax=Lacunisphaera limnophila TaxID=1838286 RepID=A0A1D8AYL3_9BACT|nr:YciI family protein [Lacunisphaera limnophila]AOS45951.1 YCII-related domain protein [Lacunisphaera limnophila]
MNPDTTSYLLLFRNAGPDVHAHLTPAQREEMTKKWNDWVQALSDRGQVAHASPLGLEGRVVSGGKGERVSDGPYAEGKEVVGGYFFLTVDTLAEATEIAKQCPGLPLGLTVEVRPVLAASAVLEGVRAKSLPT